MAFFSNSKSFFLALLLFVSCFQLSSFAAVISPDYYNDLTTRGGEDAPACPHHNTYVDHLDKVEQPQHANFEQPQNVPVYPQPPVKEAFQVNKPVKVKSTQYKGAMRTYDTAGQEKQVLRDLGYTGVLDNKIIWSFGDTLMGTPEKNFICAVDSVSLGDMQDPMRVVQTDMTKNDDVANFIDPNAQENADHGLSIYSFGGTNIVEHAPNQGLIYYYKMRRPGGNYQRIGAGVATVHMNGNIPESDREGMSHIWGEDEPSWGDVGVAYNKHDNNVYAFGHGAPPLSSSIYLARAPANQALNIEAYEYWNNATQTWSRTRPSSSGGAGFEKLTKDQAVFGWMELGQSAPFWSDYFSKWMFIAMDSFGWGHLKAWTADKLEGPWNLEGDVASTDIRPEDADKVNGLRYAGIGHPEFDPSGKTVLATWTRRNQVYGVTIEWE